MIVLSSGIASADGSPPGMPVILKGTVNIDGSPAPAGTTITAKVGGNAAGATSVLTAGSYGDTANGRLPVSASSNGAVDFYVNGIKATPSPAFTYNSNDAGNTFVVNLNAPSSTGTATPTSTPTGNGGTGTGTGGSGRTSDASSGTSGTSTGGMGTTSDKKTPTTTPKQGEGLTNAPGAPEAKDTTVKDGTTTKAVSPPFEFSSILGLFVVVVIGAIIIVVLKRTGKI